jgi:alkylation response protein AidB-like acyl-CoA dehydrogenase
MSVETRLTASLESATASVALLAAQRAAAADRQRALDPELVEGLREAGFTRHFVAARFGGTEGGFGELTRAVIALGEGCASTAWTASLAAYSARFAAHLPEQGHQELWGAGPDTFVAAGLVPSGQARTAPGGWRLDGTWPYVSAAEFADWVLLCAPVAGPEPVARFFALPRGTFRILRTWDSAGMRATGSHNVAVEDVFVPEHLSFPRSAMVEGANVVSAARCHNVPFQAVGGLTFIAPAVGAAAGALRAALKLLDGKRRAQSADIELVRSSGRVDVARHLTEQNAEVLDNGWFTAAFMARNERNVTFAAELLGDAVHGLIRAAGTGGLGESAALERFWRDVTAMTSHVALRYETAAVRTWPPVLFSGA